MTLNTVKPRSAIMRLSPSMVCATDLLLGLVTTPSEDCVLPSIRLPFEVRRSCARPREQVVARSSLKMRALRDGGLELSQSAHSTQNVTLCLAAFTQLAFGEGSR